MQETQWNPYKHSFNGKREHYLTDSFHRIIAALDSSNDEKADGGKIYPRLVMFYWTITSYKDDCGS